MLDQNAPIERLEEVVIAGDMPPTHRAWPAAELAANGDLLVTYKDGADHHRTDDGVLMLARSQDGGRTWPIRKALAAEPGWSCFGNHGMTRLADGTLLHAVMRGQHRTFKDGARQYYRRTTFTRFTRSVDGGYLWDAYGEEVQFPFAHERFGIGCYGRTQELSDGRLMTPFYTVPCGTENLNLRALAVGFSSDQGRTWPSATIIHQDLSGNICPSETDLIHLRDGRYLAVIRANAAQRLYQTYSPDEGRTWSPLEPTDMPGQSPALLSLASGAILCAYRDVRPDALGMSCAVSEDLGCTWRVLGHLYRGANRDCAYPSLVHLPDDRIFCAFYTAAQPDAMTGACEIHGLLLRDRSAL